MTFFSSIVPPWLTSNCITGNSVTPPDQNQTCMIASVDDTPELTSFSGRENISTPELALEAPADAANHEQTVAQTPSYSDWDIISMSEALDAANSEQTAVQTSYHQKFSNPFKYLLQKTEGMAAHIQKSFEASKPTIMDAAFKGALLLMGVSATISSPAMVGSALLAGGILGSHQLAAEDGRFYAVALAGMAFSYALLPNALMMVGTKELFAESRKNGLLINI